MKLGIVTVGSSLQSDQEITQLAEDMIDQLEDLEVETVVPEGFATDEKGASKLVKEVISTDVDALVYIVGSGGTERAIFESAEEVELPIFLVANSSNNSFAAACEVLPKLHSAGKLAELIFGEKIGKVRLRKRMREMAEIQEAIQKFREMRLGLIGDPSPWLVSTCANFQLIEDKIGPTITQLDLPALGEKIKGASDSEAREISQELLSDASKSIEPSKKDVVQAAKIYLGLKGLVEEHQLDAVTVGCFGLIPLHDNTGCLALSKLIDEGVVAGCEGDLETALTMSILQLLTGGSVWMANTCSIDSEENTLTFAHCTVPLQMLEDAPVLRSHFESGKGVSIQGVLEPSEKVTIARLGGPSIDKMLIASGTISQSDMGREDLCRTQVRVELDGNVEAFLSNLPGNHVAMSKGKVVTRLKDFCNGLGISSISV